MNAMFPNKVWRRTRYGWASDAPNSTDFLHRGLIDAWFSGDITGEEYFKAEKALPRRHELRELSVNEALGI